MWLEYFEQYLDSKFPKFLNEKTICALWAQTTWPVPPGTKRGMSRC